MPADGFETGRTSTAYLVPAVSVAGVAKFAAKNPPAPLLKPGMVAVARSGPVGRPPASVALTETVRFGNVPVQVLQKRSRSTRDSCPVTPAWKVCAAQFVALNPNPLFVTLRFCWSTFAGLSRV